MKRIINEFIFGCVGESTTAQRLGLGAGKGIKISGLLFLVTSAALYWL